MSALALEERDGGERFGLKGPHAAEWLTARGIAVPLSPNTWTYAGPGAAYADAHERAHDHAHADEHADAALVARLGMSEFFLVSGAGAATPLRLAPELERLPAGVYPALREDAEFVLAGDAVHEALAQVCSVNFAALALETRPVIMTLMIGVAVLVIPQFSEPGRRYRIWCDPTFGAYLGESLGRVVIDCGGSVTGVTK